MGKKTKPPEATALDNLINQARDLILSQHWQFAAEGVNDSRAKLRDLIDAWKDVASKDILKRLPSDEDEPWIDPCDVSGNYPEV